MKKFLKTLWNTVVVTFIYSIVMLMLLIGFPLLIHMVMTDKQTYDYRYFNFIEELSEALGNLLYVE